MVRFFSTSDPARFDSRRVCGLSDSIERGGTTLVVGGVFCSTRLTKKLRASQVEQIHVARDQLRKAVSSSGTPAKAAPAVGPVEDFGLLHRDIGRSSTPPIHVPIHCVSQTIELKQL